LLAQNVDSEFVIVDDGSEAAQGQALGEMISRLPQTVRAVHQRRERNLGKGATLVEAATLSSAQTLIWIDADAAFATHDVLQLVEQSLKFPSAIVVADRTKAKQHGITFTRKAFSFMFRELARGILGVSIRDL
jgi:glycosyltransferase involved in cell wall biosynthesis